MNWWLVEDTRIRGEDRPYTHVRLSQRRGALLKEALCFRKEFGKIRESV